MYEGTTKEEVEMRFGEAVGDERWIVSFRACRRNAQLKENYGRRERRLNFDRA